MRNSVESLLRESYWVNRLLNIIKRQRGLCTVKCFSLMKVFVTGEKPSKDFLSMNS